MQGIEERDRSSRLFLASKMLFLASAPGEYALYGGNEKAGAAKYDLTLVQPHLAEVLPKSVEMGKVESVSSAGFKNAFVGAFEDKSWGLYAVLGAVTLILMIVIARLFPKAEQEEQWGQVLNAVDLSLIWKRKMSLCMRFFFTSP